MSAPWPAKVATLVTGPHATTARVEATLPGGGNPVRLDVTGLLIGFDEARAPRCTAAVTCPLPEQSLLTALDPRRRVRVAVIVGYRMPSGTLEERTVATLDLRTVTEDQPAGTLTLDCGGIEARVMDHALPWLVTGTALSTIAVISDALASIAPLLVDSAVLDVLDDFDTTGDADAWTQVDDIADRIDADLFDPGDGTVRLGRRPVRASEAVHVLRTGPGGTLTRTASRRSREGWHNAVHLKYDNGLEPAAWVYGNADATGTYAPSAVGYVTFVETRQGKPTAAAANRAAAAVLTRMLTGGRSYDAEAVAAWWVRPGHTVTVETGRDAQERHLVSRVELSWPANTMRLTTRAPEA